MWQESDQLQIKLENSVILNHMKSSVFDYFCLA